MTPGPLARPHTWASDIRTWIALVFLVRLIGITDAPIETSHGWRQAFTNMVARNLAEGSFDLLHPRTDVAGEFPLFNALTTGHDTRPLTRSL